MLTHHACKIRVLDLNTTFVNEFITNDTLE